MNFTHLHVHSHYSVLDGMSKINNLVDKCLKNGMNAMALTDHGAMFGIKEFVDYAYAHNGKVKGKIKDLKKQLEEEPAKSEALQLEIKTQEQQIFKPIIGCESYCARRTLYDKDKKIKAINPENGKQYIVDQSGYHIILLAKNLTGYMNLCKMISTAWIDGNYRKPRIDKDLLEKYHEGIIVSSACLGGEIPQLILAGKRDKAKEVILWFKSIFKDDYYLEIQRHHTDKPNAETSTYERQKEVNPVILELARETNTKVIATNDVHFVEEEHAEAHDRLICLSTGKNVNDPNRMHYTKQEWLKTPEEMAQIFADVPEALTNTQEIVDKVEFYSLDSPAIMPKYAIPAEFGTEEDYHKKYTKADLFKEFTEDEHGNTILSKEKAEKKIIDMGGYNKLYRIKLEADYLYKLTWDGAKTRYLKEGAEDFTEEIKERINFELHVMKSMGFPGYFLIVQDFINAARAMGVSVGPGRGSAAGSAVAYCLRITNIDPIKYDLLFERFLNPDRISMPDIDIDFDDDGRSTVLDWVTKKYGKSLVAHIITFGTMATKSAIKDVGRVQQVPLGTVNQIVSYIPDKFGDNLTDSQTGKTPKITINNCLKFVKEIKEAYLGHDPNVSSMLKYANQLENTVRQTGIHACGVIIGADELDKFAPMATVRDKDSGEDIIVTQYDGHYVESVGLIKMDFLGLRTLSILDEAVRNVHKSYPNVTIDLETIPDDDPKTYKLFSEGKTIGTFQFESTGMRQYLMDLKPSAFEDLIAMNALYRPGPMQYIPDFIRRKHGLEPIKYKLDVMKKYLAETYGITVYQEQVMLLSRLIGSFTRGESDRLRKAMGKKKIKDLEVLKPKFITNGKKNGHDPEILESIWEDWKKFASYAFNKSHATCYSWIAYQTGYLKANYPAEYMAAVLTRNLNDITKVTTYMRECVSMKLAVKGPDINESDYNFTVNKQGDLRFGLGGIKGVGQGVVDSIVAERKKHGVYTSIYDFVERLDLKTLNTKAFESLILSGAFDTFKDISRETYFALTEKGGSFIDTLIRYGKNFQDDKQSSAATLFDGFMDDITIEKPKIPTAEHWPDITRLKKEQEHIGIYITAHPLDRYRLGMQFGPIQTISSVKAQLDNKQPGNFKICGIVVAHKLGTTKKGNPFGAITVADFDEQIEFAFFDKNYIENRGFIENDLMICVSGSIDEKGAYYKQYNNNTQADDNKPKEYRVNVNKVSLISEVYNTFLHNITLGIDVNDLTEVVVNELSLLCKKHHGTKKLGFNLIDQNKHYKLNSMNRNVDLNQEFYDGLLNLKDQFKLDSLEIRIK